MNNKPDFYVWGIPPNFNASRGAADLCVRSEAKLQSLPRTLGGEDIKLSLTIMEHAKLTLKSGDESFLAAPGFLCIMKEAELMYQLLQCKFDSTNLISFSNQIRRSALNLMMYNVDKSTAVPAAAAMVGLAREAKIARYVLAREDFEHYLDYEVCDMIREGTTKVLTKLEREFASDTSGHSGVLGASTTHNQRSQKPGQLPRTRSLQGSLCSHQSR
ncbi:uncharacterized protein [Setaria viridis]|uniref:Uncharacterized protein n=2 Tax=Setaria viridis TaxID=4556 RepID=A0A4U6V5H3_SETVI|nr:uncharacterized protein LOC117846965 isoform X2 [Setaria viridis]TKW24430.1 hypothetical protein SEVIR_3G050700v2 [Setaria viridis]TKW24433.1 hypothetical protein SEVIR_3G050700v2 [Setaria viridis]